MDSLSGLPSKSNRLFLGRLPGTSDLGHFRPMEER